MHLKMAYAKRQPSCLVLNALSAHSWQKKILFWFKFYRQLFLGCNWQCASIDVDNGLVLNSITITITVSMIMYETRIFDPKLYKYVLEEVQWMMVYTVK